MAKSEQQKLKEKLDVIFSKYIRLRDADENGYVKCVTCDYVGYWFKGKIQNGHYIRRNVLITRFDETNCHGQCESCNLWKDKNEMQMTYRESMVKMYGTRKVNKLEASRHQTMKVDKHWYKEKIEHYKKLVKELEHEKA